jgi:membrane-bound serine protease (ClpP class)
MRHALLVATCLMFSCLSTAAQSQPVRPLIVRLEIQGEIQPVLADYISAGLREASERHAALVLVRMDTPGGLDQSMRQIVQGILRSPVPVVVYVSPTGARAASAGFFILLAADVAAMAPGTHTGAASPIALIGGAPIELDQTLRKKIVEDVLAYLRSYAARRGRNVALAEKAVTEAKAFSEKEALDGHLIDLVASSEDELLRTLNGRAVVRFDGSRQVLLLANADLQDYRMSARERFLSWIVQPDIFFLLLMVGILGLYAEFTHPGAIAPGVIGGICLLLALFAMHLLPVNVAGLLLVILAIALFILEAKFAGHGILAAGGVVALVLGALMLVRSRLTPGGVSLSTAVGVAVPFAVFFVLLARLVIRSRRLRSAVGQESLIGQTGEVRQAVSDRPGLVFVSGELWRAVRADHRNAGLPEGTRVRVVGIEGLTLRVEPLADSESSNSEQGGA